MKKEIRKSRKKFWVLSKAVRTEGMDQCLESAYSRILAICKTEKQARALRDLTTEFGRASIDSVHLYE